MADIKQIKEINDLQTQLNNKLRDEGNLGDQILDGRKKQLKIYNQLIEAGKEAIKNGRISSEQLKGDISSMDKLLEKDQDIDKLRQKRKTLDKEAQALANFGMKNMSNIALGEKAQVNSRIQQIKLGEIRNTALEGADTLTGGMVTKGKDLANTIGKYGKGVGLATAGIAAAVMILISFSGKLDAIGQKFGAIGLQNREIKSDLLGAEQEAARLGKGLEDVLTATTSLTDEFGIGFSEARKTSAQVIDLGMAIGVGTDEAAKLIGNFKTLVGLSTEQAETLAKNVTLLANASDVAPQVILRDLASSSEQIALFTSDTGENIARGAIQARKLGLEFNTLSSSARSLVNYQETISNALDASILTGRQINTQKLMQLSLDGDLEGLAKEQKRVLGDENQWLKMNLFQREAMAKAVGLTVDQAAKLVNKQEEAVTLAGALAGQPGFDDLIGKEGISTLAQMKGLFASISATLVNGLGPALNLVLRLLQGIVGAVELLWEGVGLGALFRVLGGQKAEYGKGVKRGFNTMTGAFGAAPMAEGGIVPATPGGTPAIIGEGGQAEAVIPLNQLGNMNDNSDVVASVNSLKSEMSAVKDAIASLKLSTKITNKELNVVLSPQIG